VARIRRKELVFPLRNKKLVRIFAHRIFNIPRNVAQNNTSLDIKCTEYCIHARAFCSFALTETRFPAWALTTFLLKGRTRRFTVHKYLVTLSLTQHLHHFTASCRRPPAIGPVTKPKLICFLRRSHSHL
jgi:hypothetical protein